MTANPEKTTARRSTSPEQRRAWQALKALQSVGGLQIGVIFWFVALVAVVNILSGWLQDVLGWMGAKIFSRFGWLAPPLGDFPNGEALLSAASIGLLVGAIGWLRHQALKGPPDMRPTVDEKAPASPVALVLFLSTPSPSMFSAVDGLKNIEKEELKSILDAAAAKLGLPVSGDVKTMRFRQFLGLVGSNLMVSRQELHCTFEIRQLRTADMPAGSLSDNELSLNNVYALGNWRMLIDCIRPYAEANGNLREIIIIPSADGRRFNGYDNNGRKNYEHNPGSYNVLREAKAFVGLVLSANKIPFGPEVTGGIIVSGCGEVGQMPVSADYSNAEAMNELLFSVTSALRKKYGCREEDILVDITSGTALASAAAVAYSTLVPNRRFQYVNTNTYEARTYDVTHQLDLPG